MHENNAAAREPSGLLIWRTLLVKHTNFFDQRLQAGQERICGVGSDREKKQSITSRQS
jgi:hypothetical protein